MSNQIGLQLHAIPQAQARMQENEIAWLLAMPEVDILYLTGLETHLADRLTLLVVPQKGIPTLVAPALEASVFTGIAPAIKLMVWEESANPYALVANLIQTRGNESQRVAVSDKMYADILLRIQTHLTKTEFVSAKSILAQLRAVKSTQELNWLKTAARLTEAALAKFWQTTELRGMNAQQIKQRLGQLIAEQGLAPDRPLFVITGKNTGLIRQTDMTKPIQEGDPVIVDPGAGYHHYISDITRMAFVGTPPQEFLHVYQVVREAQEHARAAVAPGVPCQEIDRIARRHISSAGFGDYFTHRVGHGLGLEGHEAPFLVEGNTMPLEPNMVVTVEPGIYIPGKFGVRIEDTITVTENGYEVLTPSSHELIIQ